MKLTKLLAAGVLTFALCTVAQAEVTVLNNQNLTECRNQISSASQKNIVVAAYDPECHWWEKYQPIFTKVADSINYPATFFKYDFVGAADDVTSKCLREQISSCPTTLIYSKNAKGYSLVRTQVGFQTHEELSKFLLGK